MHTVMIEELDVVIEPLTAGEVAYFLEGVAVGIAIASFLCGGA